MSISEIIQTNPKISIIIISFLVTLLMTSIRYFVTDRKLMRDIKDKQKFVREEMKKHRDNPDKMIELNKQLMEHFPAQMKQTFKLMIITMIPVLIIFSWMRNAFAVTEIATSWIWWYIVASIVFGIILGKLFKLD